MLVNIWKNISLYCVSDKHDDIVPLKIMEGSSPFYACPKYMLQDEKHPDGHLPSEKMCKNVLSLKEAEDAVMAFLKLLEDDMVLGISGDYTGFKFTSGFVDAVVLEYKPDNIKLGLKNKRTLNA